MVEFLIILLFLTVIAWMTNGAIILQKWKDIEPVSGFYYISLIIFNLLIITIAFFLSYIILSGL